VKQSETPGYSTPKCSRAREAADGGREYKKQIRDGSTVGRSAGFVLVFGGGSWGSAALHPRLYAIGRFAGFASDIWAAAPHSIEKQTNPCQLPVHLLRGLCN
jgi:hypothetical protein